MGRQLVVITETVQAGAEVFLGKRPPFYHEICLPEPVDRFDDAENAARLNVLNAIFNYTSDMLTPHEIIHKGEPHHSEDGEPCTDICICGHENSWVENGDHVRHIKTHSDYPMRFSDVPLPEYLARMEYNRKHHIQSRSELWNTDDRYNLLEKVKDLPW